MPRNGELELAESLVAGSEEAYISWFFRNKAARPDVFGEEDIKEYTRVYSAPGAMAASFKFYQAVPESMEQNRELSAKKLSFPVLAIGGERGSTPNIGNDLRPIAPKTRGLVFPCGHYIPEEEPDRLAQELQAFFQSSRAIAEKGSPAQRTRRTQRKTEKERSNGVLE